MLISHLALFPGSPLYPWAPPLVCDVIELFVSNGFPIQDEMLDLDTRHINL